MNNDQQLELNIDSPELQPEAIEQKAKRARTLTPFKRTCPQCENEYTAFTKKSVYCSPRCRLIAIRSGNAFDKQPIKTVPTMTKSVAPIADEAVEEKKLAPMPRPKFNNLSPDMDVAINLLYRELDRTAKMYEDEKAKRKKIQGKYEALKDQVKDDKHAQALAGLEVAKPDLVERILNGFTQLPAPIVESMAPALGRMMNKLVPEATPGVAGQLQGGESLDPMTADLVRWLAAMTPETREIMFLVIGGLMGTEPEKLQPILVQFLNLIKSGTTLSGPDQNITTIQPPLPYDERMYNL